MTQHLGCDCHIHIYDIPSYPLEQTSPVSPPQASWSDYLRLQKAMNLGRAVIVQPTGYAFDNRCTLDALARSAGTARAIVTLPVDTCAAVFSDLDKLGVRGVRFMMVPGAPQVMQWKDLLPMAHHIAPHDWTINLQLDGRDLPAYESSILSLPCKVVIDHVGKFLDPVDLAHPGFKSLCNLLDSGRVWVKLSAPYETSKLGPPGFEDVGRLARELAHRYPQRCLWASNWPHPGQHNRPNEANLLNLLTQWVASDRDAQDILVNNPAQLYRF